MGTDHVFQKEMTVSDTTGAKNVVCPRFLWK
jgi:hypothetical protein